MMTNQTIKRILAFTMACALLLCGTQALADQVYVSGSVAVYDQPGETASRLGTLKGGARVNVAAEKDGWAMIKKGDAVGYVKSSGLVRVETVDKIIAYARADATMYKSISTDSKKMGVIPEGGQVTVTARANDMAYVRYGKHKGFVQSSMLTTEAPGQAGATGETEASAASRTVYVARDGAKVYSAKGKVITTLSANTELTLTGIKGSVCRVRRDGATAYMAKADLSDAKVAVTEPVQKPEEQGKETEKSEQEAGKAVSAYVNKDGAKVYNAKGKAIGTLSANTAVTITAVKGRVCRVSANGRTAYMRKADLSGEKVKVKEEETIVTAAAYVGKDGAKVYNAKGEQIGTLKLNAAVTVTAVKDDLCQVLSDGKTAYMNRVDLSAARTETAAEEIAAQQTSPVKPTGASTVSPAKGTAKEMDWWTSDIQTIFARGTVAQITDVATGISWREQRRGGTNHADVQPMTAADTAAMKKACGSWSWSRRAIFVTINGVNYAASMNCMPHGSGSIADNDFNGHHCIHFTNSRTHGGNKVCSLHQAAIKKAASTTL